MSAILVGTSGWSYPSWRPGFYPAELRPEEFLSFYASQLPTVELNSTKYRLPSEEQFASWAAQVPDGFRFAVKAPASTVRRVDVFVERVRALGDRLGAGEHQSQRTESVTHVLTRRASAPCASPSLIPIPLAFRLPVIPVPGNTSLFHGWRPSPCRAPVNVSGTVDG